MRLDEKFRPNSSTCQRWAGTNRLSWSAILHGTGNVPSDSRPLPELAGINALRSLTLDRGYPEPILILRLLCRWGKAFVLEFARLAVIEKKTSSRLISGMIVLSIRSIRLLRPPTMEAWTKSRSSVEACSFPNPAWSGGAKQMPRNQQPLLGGRVSASGYHSEGGEA